MRLRVSMCKLLGSIADGEMCVCRNAFIISSSPLVFCGGCLFFFVCVFSSFCDGKNKRGKRIVKHELGWTGIQCRIWREKKAILEANNVKETWTKQKKILKL
jgi:hypothetical protein